MIFNISWNAIEDIAYLTASIKNLTNITSLELKLHHCQLPINQIIEIVGETSLLFEEKLSICKITFDRCMVKEEFKSMMVKAVSGVKTIKVDVLGYDNRYFMVFIKKINRGGKNRINTGIIKPDKQSMFQTKSVVDEKEEKKIGCCLSFYSNNRSYDNYVCLSCSELYEMSKCEYYCKFCIENCRHKGHSIVKIY